MKTLLGSFVLILFSLSAHAVNGRLKCDLRYTYVPQHVELTVINNPEKYISLRFDQQTGMHSMWKPAILSDLTGDSADSKLSVVRLETRLEQLCPLANFNEQTVHCQVKGVRSTVEARGYVGEVGDMSEWRTRRFQVNMDVDVTIEIGKIEDGKTLSVSGTFKKTSDATKLIEVATSGVCQETEL